jgi:AraC family transcriptional regulator
MSRIMMAAGGRTHPLILNRSNPEPLLSSSSTPWAGLPFEEHRIGATERAGKVGPVDGEYGLLTITEGQFDILVRRGGREVRHVARPSSMSLLSGNHRREVLGIRGSATVIAINITQPWFGLLALEGAPASFGEGEPYAPDPTVHSLVRAMRDEVARGAPTGRLYAESLSLALLSYVVERLPDARAHGRGNLCGAQQRQLQRYVRDHLHEELTLNELAGVVGLSPRYFTKLFRAAFGTTPHRYVTQQRLAEGARLLARGGHDLVDVALRLGFCSQSHFTAAFRQAYGVTPHRYATGKRARAGS